MGINWTINDVRTVEKSPTSPARLQWKISEVLLNSSACRCKVESINPTTGEYRIVLQGTLDVTPDNYNQNFNS